MLVARPTTPLNGCPGRGFLSVPTCSGKNTPSYRMIVTHASMHKAAIGNFFRIQRPPRSIFKQDQKLLFMARRCGDRGTWRLHGWGCSRLRQAATGSVGGEARISARVALKNIFPCCRLCMLQLGRVSWQQYCLNALV